MPSTFFLLRTRSAQLSPRHLDGEGRAPAVWARPTARGPRNDPFPFEGIVRLPSAPRPGFASLGPALCASIEPSASLRMDTDEHVIVPGTGAVKLLIFSRKAAHLTTAAYLAHWVGQHKDVVIAQSDFMAFVRGYRQHHVIPDSVCNGVDEGIAPSSRFDGVIEQWFDTVEDAVRAYQSTGYQIQVRQDEPNFLSVGASIATFVDERPL